MSNQTEQEKQQTMTPEELHQPLQAELDAIRQAIEALSDEQLKAITGGAGGGKSWWICEKRLVRAYQYPGIKGFIGRKELKRLTI